MAKFARTVALIIAVYSFVSSSVYAASPSVSVGLTASVVIKVITPPAAIEGSDDLGVAPQTGQLAFTVTRNEDGTISASDQSTFQLPISFSYRQKKNVAMLVSARWSDSDISNTIPLQLYVDTGEISSEMTPTEVAQGNFRCRGAQEACTLPAVPNGSAPTPVSFYQNDTANYDSAAIKNAVFHLGFMTNQGGSSSDFETLLAQTFEDGKTYQLELTFTVGAQS